LFTSTFKIEINNFQGYFKYAMNPTEGKVSMPLNTINNMQFLGLTMVALLQSAVQNFWIGDRCAKSVLYGA